MKQKVMVCANFLNSFCRKKDERRFRQLDYMLLLLIVTVNKFLKLEINHFLKLRCLVLGDYKDHMPWFLRQINLLNFPR